MTGATGTAVRKWLQLLPWPLANALKRAHNDKTAQGRHNAAYYFFEASLKLAACAQVGSYLALGASDPKLDEELKTLAKASAGSWLQMLNLFSAYIARRPDAALLPLSGVYKRLTEPLALPAARAFLDRNETNLGQGRTTIMELFGALVAHRNDEMGHGAQRDGAFYDAAAPLILHATLESLDHLQPFGDSKLALSRDVAVERTGETARRFMLLEGDGLHTWMDAAPADAASPAGRLWLIGGASRIPLHPLMIYEAGEMDRVGFLNKVVGRPKGDAITIKRCEYLDYYSGERLQSRDAATELAALFSQLYQTRVTTEDVEKLSMEPGAETSQPGASPGRVAIGDFEILGELGRGGMGVVYKARQLTLGRFVALKVLAPALAGDPIAVARFRREIKALGMCDHPNVVKVLTAGQDGDRHFYAMEYVDGCDLSALYEVLSAWGKNSGNLREGHITQAITSAGKLCQARKDISDNCEGLSEEQVREKLAQEIPEMPQLKEGRAAYERLAELMSEAADGLQHMHERGIIHRDLKPGNLMLTADGRRIVLMDFGLAQLENASLSLTRSADKILGTLRYMAPEQADAQLRGELVSERSDIYSFGATLYELTTLKPIFEGQSQVHLLEQVQRKEPITPGMAKPGLPRDLETIIIKATQKDRELRYAQVGPSSKRGTFGADLSAFAKGEPISARPPSQFHYLSLFYRRNRVLVNGLGAVAAVLMMITAGFVVTLQASRNLAQTAARESLDAKRIAEMREMDALAARENEAKARKDADASRDEFRRAHKRAETLNASVFSEVYTELEPLGRLDVLVGPARAALAEIRSNALNQPNLALSGLDVRWLFVIGRIFEAYGDYGIAVDAFRLGLSFVGNDDSVQPERLQLRSHLVQCLTKLGQVDEGEQAITEQDLELTNRLKQSVPDAAVVLMQARAHLQRADIAQRRWDRLSPGSGAALKLQEAAIDNLRRALEVVSGMPSEFRDDDWIDLSVAIIQRQARWQGRMARWTLAAQLYESGIKLIDEQLIGNSSRERSILNIRKASLMSGLSICKLRELAPDAAFTLSREAAKTVHDSSGIATRTLSWVEFATGILLNCSTVLFELNDYAASLKEAETLQTIVTPVVHAYPFRFDLIDGLCNACNRAALAQSKLGRLDAVEEHFHNSWRLRLSAFQTGKSPFLVTRLLESCSNWANSLLALGQLDRAVTAYSECERVFPFEAAKAFAILLVVATKAEQFASLRGDLLNHACLALKRAKVVAPNLAAWREVVDNPEFIPLHEMAAWAELAK